MAEGQQQIDHYDFIQAPQFVDFEDLQAQDDPDADRFFETHREEDDFLIPLDVDCISPTVQLLDEQNVHYSNEANKAAIAAGLEDVKIEYYASPQQSTALSQPSSANKTKSITSIYGTPLGNNGSSVLSPGAFHTPMGGEDKENETPRVNQTSAIKQTGEKFNEMKEEKDLRGILAERSFEGIQNLSFDSPFTIISMKKTETKSIPTQSLMSKLDQLEIVSSDSDEEDMPTNFNHSGLKASSKENEALVLHSESEVNYNTFSLQKMNFLNLNLSESGTPDQKNVVENEKSFEVGDVTVIVDPSKSAANEEAHSDESDFESDGFGSTSVELGAHVQNILKKLDAELNLEDEDGPRYSILVAPSVGEQVHWSAGNTDTHQIVTNTADEKELNLSYDVEDAFTQFTAHQGSSGGIEGGQVNELDWLDNSSCSTILMNNRRASSVGDLVQALEIQPKERNFKTYGYNPRAGITIPKTPDVPPRMKSMKAEKSSPKNILDSGKNSCYFEIDPPGPSKNLRRVSSCGDLLKLQQKAKTQTQRTSAARRGLTIPRTPDTAKRVSKRSTANKGNSNSMAIQTSKQTLPPPRNKITTLPTVAERLASVQNHKPMRANHYVSMAEAMIKYQKNTPDRFRSLPKGRVPEKRSASNDSRKRASPSPARTPESASDLRSRAGSFSERKESSKAAQNGPVLPKKVELKPTVPRPFNLSTTYRKPKTAAVITQKEEDVTDFKFKARPAPSKILQDTVVLHKPKSQIKVTKPMAPHFASDDRLRQRQQKRATSVPKSPETKQTKVSGQKTSKIPTHNTSIQRAHVEEHKTTVVQPFSESFEARQNETLRRKEVKVKQELEAQKVREFHANPVPKFTTKLPRKKLVEATNVEPFNLKSDERGAAYQEAFKKKLEEEEQHLREQAVFHAQPADVIHKPPFEPERPARVIETHDLNLATEKRAVEREHFDEQVRERERDEEERKQEEQARLEELQRQDDIERRRQLVHKAQPFKPPKQFQVKNSSKPLTVPQSPAFQALPSDRRIKPQSPNTQ